MLQVDADRFRTDFDSLAAIGATPAGGVARPTFGDAHLEARAWFLDCARAAGLETNVDAAGNHSAVLRSRVAGAPTLLLGSHLDSVPDGGRFDGALGVAAALEAIDFTDEEGTLVGLLGSWAVAGALAPETLRAPRGGREALLDGLARAGLAEERLSDARRDPGSLAAYLELHIEQGPVLEREGVDIGVVTGIVGSRSFRLTFTGVSGHAGTTPMEARRDAGVAAAAFVVAVRDTVVRGYPGCVATVGSLAFEPGAFNVIPGRARLALEFRSLDAAQLDELQEELLALARAQGVDVEVEPVGRWEATPLDTTVQRAIRGAADSLGLSTRELASGAGHDAQALAAVTRSGMLFVPSRRGISHAPDEHTEWEDCVNGANVLLGAALTLAHVPPNPK